VIDQFTKCQSRPYMFHKVDVIQDYIEKRLVPVSDQELDQIAEEQLEKEKSAHEQTRSRIHFHKSKKSVHNASGSNTNSPSDSAKK
jgi:predicted kinase